MEGRMYWDASSLAIALAETEPVASGRISLSFIPDADADGVMEVTLHDFGDLAVVLGVAGREIQASVALVPVAQIQNSAVFDRQLLRANKLLPLSTFGITTIGGEDYYEIFGQMSGASRIDEVIEEVETLGRNALDAAEMIETWKTSQAA
jgi:uncharacterized protein YjfI (DUF2170 family)